MINFKLCALLERMIRSILSNKKFLYREFTPLRSTLINDDGEGFGWTKFTPDYKLRFHSQNGTAHTVMVHKILQLGA